MESLFAEVLEKELISFGKIHAGVDYSSIYRNVYIRYERWGSRKVCDVNFYHGHKKLKTLRFWTKLNFKKSIPDVIREFFKVVNDVRRSELYKEIGDMPCHQHSKRWNEVTNTLDDSEWAQFQRRTEEARLRACPVAIRLQGGENEFGEFSLRGTAEQMAELLVKAGKHDTNLCQAIANASRELPD